MTRLGIRNGTKKPISPIGGNIGRSVFLAQFAVSAAFSRIARSYLLHIGNLNWKQI